MKHLFLSVVFLCYLLSPFAAFSQSSICWNESFKTTPQYRPVVKLKTLTGREVLVNINTYYNSCGTLNPNPNPTVTRAGNCHAWALYIGQGGPYHGSQRFNLAGFQDPIPVINSCTVLNNYVPTNEFYKFLDDGFVGTNDANWVKGDVLLFFRKDILVNGRYFPWHSAMSNGDGTFSQVRSMDGIYQSSVARSTIMWEYYENSPHKENLVAYHYRRKNTNAYPANSYAGIERNTCSNVSPCANITAPVLLCAGNTSTTQLNMTTSLPVTWRGEPAGNFSPSSGSGKVASFTALGGGKSRIIYKVGDNDCYKSPAITIGSYDPSEFPISGPSAVYGNNYVTVTAPYLPNVQTNGYLWEAYSSGTSTPLAKTAGGSSFSFYAPSPGFSMITILLRVRNICNSSTDPHPTQPSVFHISEIRSSYYRQGEESADLMKETLVYPVPAKDELKIAIKDSGKEQVSTITVFNSLGQEVIKRTTKALSATLQVGHLKEGIYYVNIENSSGLFKKKISIIK